MNQDSVFHNERGQKIDVNRVEAVEQKLAREHILEDDIVLELGARYGTVTVQIGKKLKDDKLLVAVEPDSRVWSVLDANLQSNGCKAKVWKGFVSSKQRTLQDMERGDGYGTNSIEDATSKIPTISFSELQMQECFTFNVLVADCEGFLLSFLQEAPQILSQLRMIIFEKDHPDKCDYCMVESLLKTAGLEPVVTGFHSVWKRAQ